MTRLTKNQKIKLKNEYLTTNISIKELCKKYNICEATFYNFKEKEKIITRPLILKECNENFFENLNTEKSAYWAGFILGDGYLVNNKIKISLSSLDIDHLRKFQIIINSEHVINITTRFNKYWNNNYECCTIQISRKKLVDDLIKHGITKDKSKHCVISRSIPENILHHFLRGVFDADGCIYFSQDQKNLRFSVVSSVESFLEEYQQVLMKECDLNKTKIYPNKQNTCYDLRYSGKDQVKRIMNYLYKDATIYLERKYNKFQEFYKND